MKFKSIVVKAVVNKKNGQINFSLPKKKLPVNLKQKIMDVKSMKIKIED